MMQEIRNTGEDAFRGSSSINVLFHEISQQETGLREIDELTHKINEIDDRIITLEAMRDTLQNADERKGVDWMIAKLGAKRAKLVQERAIKQSGLQQARDTTQKKLARRLEKRLRDEIEIIRKRGKYTGDTLNEVAAAGLAAYVYDAIILDGSDNQPQERNNHVQ